MVVRALVLVAQVQNCLPSSVARSAPESNRTGVRQVGQAATFTSHVSTHLRWNTWPHPASFRHHWPLRNPSKQMTQWASGAGSDPEETRKRGRLLTLGVGVGRKRRRWTAPPRRKRVRRRKAAKPRKRKKREVRRSMMMGLRKRERRLEFDLEWGSPSIGGGGGMIGLDWIGTEWVWGRIRVW